MSTAIPTSLQELHNVMERPRAVHTFTIPSSLRAHATFDSIGLVELTGEEELTAQKACGGEIIHLAHHLAKASWRFAGDKKLSFADGSIHKEWSSLHPKIRTLVIRAYHSIHNPGDDAVEDFLSSHAMSAG